MRGEDRPAPIVFDSAAAPVESIARPVRVPDIPADDTAEAPLMQRAIVAVQDRLDTFARTRGYDSMLSACSYMASAVAQFSGEAAYCISARDDTWAACFQIQTDVMAGTRSMPTTVEEILAELPALVWPS